MVFRFGSLPIFLGVLTILFLVTTKFNSSVAQSLSPPDGEALYLSRCSSCHQANGEGITGVFPPLNGVDWVTGDQGRLIRIILDGVMGQMQVGNMVYTGVMPPWKTFMNDQEIAAMLTYIRTAWENDASEVTADEVRLVREHTSDQRQAWTTTELSDPANQGIPDSLGVLNSATHNPDS